MLLASDLHVRASVHVTVCTLCECIFVYYDDGMEKTIIALRLNKCSNLPLSKNLVFDKSWVLYFDNDGSQFFTLLLYVIFFYLT